MNKTTFLLLRLAIGTSLFGHGLVRMPKLAAFSNWMVDSFSNSILPEFLVRPFSYVLPFVELITGLLLIVGLFTKQTLVVACLAMTSLILGSALIESWDAISVQLIHVAFLAVLLQFIKANAYSLDSVFNARKSETRQC